MAAKKEKKGRLDPNSLEQALEAAFTDEPVEVTGHEKSTGIDPSFAGKLHDKLEGEIAVHPEIADEAEGETGLRAPACTTVLTAQDLAALDDEDEDGEKVAVDAVNHGFIDNINPQLVTELNKKLSDEVAAEAKKSDQAAKPAAKKGALGPRGAPRGFTVNLSSALDKLADDEEEEEERDKAKPAPKAKSAFGGQRGFTANLNAALGKLDGPDDQEQNQARPARGFTSNLNAALDKLSAAEDGETKAVSSDPFASDLSARLAQAGEGNTDDAFNEDRRDSGAEASQTSGLKAPNVTVKLSADALASLDDEDDVMDSAMVVAQSQGAITYVDKSLVDALNARLGGDEDKDDVVDADAQKSGFRAPMNTVKLDASMIPDDEDDDACVVSSSKHGNIDTIDGDFAAKLQQKLGGDDDEPLGEVSKGCRAPQVTVKLGMDMLAGLDDDDEIPESHEPLSVMESAALALGKVADPEDIPADTRDWGEDIDLAQENAPGLRAPAATQLITADMLANLDDEDDEDLMGGNQNPGAPSSKSNFDASFAGSLQSKLAQADGIVKGSACAQGDPDEAFSPDDDADQSGAVRSGLQAPATTCNLTADQLAQLDLEDEDDDPAAGIGGGGLDDEPEKPQGGLRAPQTTQVVSADMLAGIDDDDEANDLMAGCGPGPSAEQLRTLTEAVAALGEVPGGSAPKGQPQPALTMESGSATKVIQTMRDEPLGQAKRAPSSCKLRLAWLSKEEVRKENDKLRQEINALRAEVEMHRKQSTRKA